MSELGVCILFMVLGVTLESPAGYYVATGVLSSHLDLRVLLIEVGVSLKRLLGVWSPKWPGVGVSPMT